MAKADIHDRTDREGIDLASVGSSAVLKSDVKVIEVVLSERNLLSLLAKLHIDGSKRTIYNDYVPDGYVLKLIAEDDDTHYGERVVPPGEMHRATEGLVARLQETLKTYAKDMKIVHLFNKAVDDSRGESA